MASAPPSYSGLYGGLYSFTGQNGYAGTGQLSSPQFAGTGDAGSSVGGSGIGDAGGQTAT